MDFSDALRIVKADGYAWRPNWPGPRPRLELVQPGPLGDGRVLMPELQISYPDGTVRPFAGSNYDLLAEDWVTSGRPA